MLIPGVGEDDDLEVGVRHLRFSRDLENRFKHNYYLSSLPHLRVFISLVLFLLVILGLQDALASGRDSSRLLFVKFGLVAPILVALLLFTRLRVAARWMQPAAGLTILLVAASLLINSLGSAASLEVPHLLPQFILLVICTYTVSRLLFRAAVVVGWTLVLMYCAAVLNVVRGRHALMAWDTVDLLVANFAGTWSAFSTERHLRRDFAQQRKLNSERALSDRLLLNVLPATVAARLKRDSTAIAEDHAEVTVLFADLVGFTPLATAVKAAHLVNLLNEIFSRFDALVANCGLEKIKTIGDSYMAVAGLPEPAANHATRAARLALSMLEEIAKINLERGTDLQLRIGLSSGPVIAGVIGTHRFIYDLWGDTVNVAHRMETHGMTGRIQLFADTAGLLEPGFHLEDRGPIEVKGKGLVHTFWLCGEEPAG